MAKTEPTPPNGTHDEALEAPVAEAAEAEDQETANPPGLITKDLACKLTDEELTEKIIEFQDLMVEREDLEDEKKATADSFKRRIGNVDEQLTKLGRQIKAGEEFRPVECEWDRDFSQNVRRLVRTDTNEVIQERALTAEERQMELGEARSRPPDELTDEATA